MVEVRSAFSPRSRYYSSVGDGVVPVFQPSFVKGDARVLKETGKRDLYAIIQSFKEECSVKRIVERYTQGDLSVLSRVQALYTDVSGLPSSLDQAFEKVREAHAAFLDLTPEAQEYYGDPGAFVQRFAAGDIFQPKVEEVPGDD